MQHPEEGIIHAWIDGALSLVESAELESHVAGCPECAARVAEARGLVAASSRIVAHLDAVPAKVIPARPATRRSWGRAAWPMAAAATLILAISLYSRESAQKASPESVISSALDIAAADSAPSAAPVSRDMSTPAPSTKVGSVEPPRRLAAVGNVASGAGGTASGGQARTAAPPPPPPTAPSLPQSGASISAAQTAPTPAALKVAETRAASPPILGSTVVTGAQSAGGAGSARRERASTAPARAQADMAVAERAESDMTRAFMGCYELNASTDILPGRFALVADTATALPGLRAIRYLDASGRLTDRIVDAGWTIEAGRVIVRTAGRGVILSFTKVGTEVSGESPNGPRTGRVASCR
ncbi:MAG TPA: zf-HC2 domain-containing protein [Gemmatimonadaceae bacterium]|nr:zf-HC2 domain-containing protein [Gemmatimonadaceae bacterium]